MDINIVTKYASEITVNFEDISDIVVFYNFLQVYIASAFHFSLYSVVFLLISFVFLSMIVHSLRQRSLIRIQNIITWETIDLLVSGILGFFYKRWWHTTCPNPKESDLNFEASLNLRKTVNLYAQTVKCVIYYWVWWISLIPY